MFFFLHRSPSKRYARRTVGGITREVIMEEKNIIDGYRNVPSANNYIPKSQSQNTILAVNSLNRYDNNINSHIRSTLPTDYKAQSEHWSAGSNRNDKSDEYVPGLFFSFCLKQNQPPVLL